jgi:hypothetical protein
MMLVYQECQGDLLSSLDLVISSMNFCQKTEQLYWLYHTAAKELSSGFIMMICT